MDRITGCRRYISLIATVAAVAVFFSACSRSGKTGGSTADSTQVNNTASADRQTEKDGTGESKNISGGTDDGTSDGQHTDAGKSGTANAALGEEGKADSQPAVGNDPLAVSTGNEAKAAEKAPDAGSRQASEPAKNDVKPNEVSISITGPKKAGVILSSTAVEFSKGDTVMDILKKITRQKNIQAEFKGSKATAYVKGISNIYEFDYGAKSGWIYRVNGKIPSVSSGMYEVNAGDNIEWLYTLDMGKEYGDEAEGK